MDTLDFLRAVLPSQGIYVLTEFREGLKGRPTQRAFDTIDRLAAAAIYADRRGYEVYHACSSFAELRSKRMRTQENAAFVRSQWLDVDVGPGKDYPDRRSAIEAVAELSNALSLPTPMVVSSGRGWHCYWRFDEDVPAAEAAKAQTSFMGALKALDFRHDTSRTTDLASILRPAGTHWRKDGEIEVKVIKEGRSIPFADFCAAVEAISPRLPKALEMLRGAGDFSTGPKDYPPSSTLQILKFCPTMAYIAEEGGNVAEPLWRAMLGLVKHTTEGDEMAHNLSQGHPQYDAEQTQEKLDNWNKGPTTCAEFSRHSELCADCPRAEKVSSPIHLGYTVVAPEAPDEEDEPAAAPEAPAEVDIEAWAEKQPYEIPHLWQPGYRWADGWLSRALPDEDGQIDWLPFCRMLFYPYKTVTMEDGTQALGFCLQVRKGKWARFEIPTKTVSDPRTLAAALGAYGIMFAGNNGKQHGTAMVADMLHALHQAAAETTVVNAFGWEKDGFVLGKRRVTGSTTYPVVANRKLPPNILEGLHESGTVEGWVSIVNEVYNRRGAEPYQFLICASFAAPLIQLMRVNMWHGIGIGIVGEGGEGKTTAAAVACSIYGDANSFIKDASPLGSTEKALLQRLAAMKNLPQVFDEIGQRDQTELKNLVFAMAHGQERDRLAQDGSFASSGRRWWNFTFVTGNESIVSKVVTGDMATTEATQMRIFEIRLPPGFSHDVFTGVPAKRLLSQELMPNHYGVVGREWLQWIQRNQEAVVKTCMAIRDKLAPRDAEGTRERFFLDTVTVTIAAAKLATRLGYIHFDVDRLLKWALDTVRNMRSSRENARLTIHDLVHKMMSDLADRIVITRYFRDGRKKTPPEEPLNRTPPKAPIGRIATDDKVCVLSVAGVRAWCSDSKLGYDWFVNEMDRHDYLIVRRGADFDKTRIFKGTTLPGGSTKCLELQFHKVYHLADPTTRGTVVPLSQQPEIQQ